MAIAQMQGAGMVGADQAGRHFPQVLLASDFRDVADLAREISGAGAVCIRLAGESGGRVRFYPEREGIEDLPAVLLRGEKSVVAETELEAAGFPGMQFWAGFPLRGPADRVIGLMGVMDTVPHALSHRTLRQLQMLADVLASKVVLADSAVEVMARRMLRLVEDVVEVDDAAASPALRGLLRFAAGDTPSSTEAMALRIAGLADAKGGKLSLTQVAEGILSHHGIGGAARVADMPELAVAEAVVPSAPDFNLMARLRIGEVNHDIARSEALDSLAFRLSGRDPVWQVLENGLEEGWPEIIAEVLRKTRDVVMEYVRMHMIHQRDARLPEGQYRYDLYGMSWTLRGTPDHAEVLVEGGDWVTFDASGVAWDHPRDLSALAAIAAYPDIDDRIGTDVHEWCKRIAAGSEVTPVF